MSSSRENLTIKLDALLSIVRKTNLDDYSMVEQRLLGCISVLGDELKLRLEAGPLKRLVIEHDLHKLSDMPLLQQLPPAQVRQVVAQMERPDADGRCT